MAVPTGSDSSSRTPWRRDYGRLLHSAAFRRLQGKTQLFPSHESDFFRNRLTHSLEVAQIAKSIALRLNGSDQFFSDQGCGPIDTDLVETAALAHDLGHPPFGHNGEAALDECMRDAGGFEGNAQTLRILARVEKRQTAVMNGDEVVVCSSGMDRRVGLNLTFRSLAAVLKYDKTIPMRKDDRATDEQSGPIKGYYQTERELVTNIKSQVGNIEGRPFRTIECSIMDVADDIAYSTYDLEDAFKGGFLTPLSIISAQRRIITNVANKVQRRLRSAYPDAPADAVAFGVNDVYHTLINVFAKAYGNTEDIWSLLAKGSIVKEDVGLVMAQRANVSSSKTASRGYYRTQLTSELVNDFVGGVEVVYSPETPALSVARLNLATLKRVETLKNFTYESIIMSSMLKVAEHRGKDIVKAIFGALSSGEGHYLMPEDFRDLYDNLASSEERRRVICDFISGMTDRYAIQFYGRLFGTNPESIHSPL